MLYGARGCQLLSACKAAGAPFDVVLACDPSANARTLLRTHSQCLCVVEDLGKLARAVASNVEFNAIGYTLHMPLDEDRIFYAIFGNTKGASLKIATEGVAHSLSRYMWRVRAHRTWWHASPRD